MYIEYYDIRNGKTEDYGLNVNDNTQIIVQPLWYHYGVTGGRNHQAFCRPVACNSSSATATSRSPASAVSLLDLASRVS